MKRFRLFWILLLAGVAAGQSVVFPSQPTNTPNQIDVTTSWLYLNKLHYAGAWSSIPSYSSQDLVTYQGVMYVSVGTGNRNNAPSVASLYWAPVSLHGSTHAAAGVDPLTLSESQITSLLTHLAATEKTANKDQNGGYVGKDANGNVTIGTTVVGPNSVTAQGTAATDVATMGAELLDGTGWTSTGWTGAFNTFTHTAGNTSVLSRPIPGIAAGQFYQVVITISSSSAGSLTFSIGGTVVTAPEGGAITGNASFRAGPQTVSGADFTITPTSDFNGAVALSVKLITPAAVSGVTIKDSTGAVSQTLSQSLATQHNMCIGGASATVGYVGNGCNTYATTGTFNTAFGPNAPLASNTTGTYNTAIGGGVLRSNATGWYNTGVGDDSLAFNTVGYNNSAFGVDALYQNTSGFNNNCFGLLSCFSNTTGSGNIGIGYGALYANVTGTTNLAIGTNALYKATVGFNTAIGHSAMLNQVTGTNNTALGYQSMASANGANQNVSVGSSAGYKLSFGANNVFVGWEAGYTSVTANGVTTGASDTFVGADAGPGSSTQISNAIGLGYQAQPIASNTAVIGNASLTDVYLGGTGAVATLHTAGGSSNHGICWKTATTLGYCSTVLAADGTCTCN